jgi:hypothetical protein
MTLYEKKTACFAAIAEYKQKLITLSKFYPYVVESFTPERFKQMEQKNKDVLLNVNKINQPIIDIMDKINMKIQIIKKQVILNAKLRDTEPDFDIQILKELEYEVKKEQEKLVKYIPPHPFVANWKFENYFNKVKEYNDKRELIIKRIQQQFLEIEQLDKLILEEAWRPNYESYAKAHNLKVDSESIFRVCNHHYLNSFCEDWTFDCNCKKVDHTNSQKLHYFNKKIGICNRGTKMNIKVVDPNVDTIIGFIHKDIKPQDYCELYGGPSPKVDVKKTPQPLTQPIYKPFIFGQPFDQPFIKVDVKKSSQPPTQPIDKPFIFGQPFDQPFIFGELFNSKEREPSSKKIKDEPKGVQCVQQ